MTMSDETTQLIFSAPTAEGEFPLLRAGQFVKGGRRISVTPDNLEQAAANFGRWKDAGHAVPIDYDHSFAGGGSSKAAGWLESVRHDGDKLYGKVEWTEPARSALERDEYRYFSPEFTPSHKNESGQDEGFSLVSGALTNRPFLRGMTRVAFSADAVPEVGVELDAMAQEIESFKEGEPGAPELARPVDENHGEMPDVETTETFAVEISGEEFTFTHDEIVDLYQRAADAETLAARVQAVERDLATERFSIVFSQAQREGRVDAKAETRERWHQRFVTMGHEEAREILFEIPAETVVPVGGAIGTESDAEGSQPHPAAPEGVEPESFEIDRRANELMADDSKLEYGDAVIKAAEEMAR